jgi:GNAT superfamily N-acetyltransferase
MKRGKCVTLDDSSIFWGIKDMHEVRLAEFEPADQREVKALILAGLVDHWGFLDPSKNPDLDDIPSCYAGASFLVARLGERIVGCGALVSRGEGIAEIVRMSVAKDLRGEGIGTQVLTALLEQARRQGVSRVVLETTAAWSEVVNFYLKNGFKITHYRDEDVFFERKV